MASRLDVFSLSFFGIGSISVGGIFLADILFHIAVVTSLWACILLVSCSMMGYVGTKLFRLFVGEQKVRAYYLDQMPFLRKLANEQAKQAQYIEPEKILIH